MSHLPQYIPNLGVTGTAGGVLRIGGSACKGPIFIAIHFERSTETLHLT